jgi:hypothetical protein
LLKEAGANAFLEKSINTFELEKAVKHFLLE